MRVHTARDRLTVTVTVLLVTAFDTVVLLNPFVSFSFRFVNFVVAAAAAEGEEEGKRTSVAGVVLAAVDVAVGAAGLTVRRPSKEIPVACVHKIIARSLVCTA